MNESETHHGARRWSGLTAVLAAAVLLTGCGDLFDVTNPGAIREEDLNTQQGIDALVVGMSADYSAAVDENAFMVARASDEMAGSGSYSTTALWRRGVVRPEDVNFLWENTQRARWVAEDGIERMQEVLGDDFQGNPKTSRAYLFAGLSNVELGEMFCRVTFDGGEPQPKSAAFERAIPHFENAIQHGQQAGENGYVTAARGGIAQAHVGLGNWDQAAQAASQIPTDFVHEAIYSNNSGREENVFVNETHERHEASAFGTLAGSFSPPDPRAPYTDCRDNPQCRNAIGADGVTTHFRQEKYQSVSANVPVVKGTEMRLIEAEAALRSGNVEEAVSHMNEARAFYGLEPMDADTISSSSTSFSADDQAWSILDRERHLTLWLEGKRLFDLHRWGHPFLQGGQVAHGGIANRASCVPIADSERQTNPNVSTGG